MRDSLGQDGRAQRTGETPASAWIVALLVASTFVFYTGAKENEALPTLQHLRSAFSWVDPAKTCAEMRKALGLIAMSLLSLSLVAGPLYRWYPSPRALALVRERKRLGLVACVFGAAHSALSLGSWRTLVSDLTRAPMPRIAGLVAGATGAAIFWRMAITSSERAVARLGVVRWKRIHNLGGLALTLCVAHFVCMEAGPGGLHVRLYGLGVLGVALSVAVVRAVDRRGVPQMRVQRMGVLRRPDAAERPPRALAARSESGHRD
jgi:sulfoxide reductase heme-binding subunit YedZ